MENANAKSERLFSLDLLRGLDMMFLTVLGPLLYVSSHIWKLPRGLTYQLSHPWEGFTCWDLIMPMFIFMCGAAIPLSLERRLARNGGRADLAYWKHVLWRLVMLWGLGLLVQGRIATLDPDQIRLYDNTLQTIAFGYVVCAVTAALTRRTWVKLAIPIGSFVLYGVLLHAFGDYSQTGNFAFKVEKAILTAIVPATSVTARELAVPQEVVSRLHPNGLEVHYTWYLTSLMFVFMTFCGYFSTKILQAQAAQRTKALRLFGAGAGLLALGWVLAFCGVRMVKHVFTVSFTAQAMGWCMILLAALYVLTDIWKLRRGLGICILFGQFALTAYMIEEFFKPVAEQFAGMLLEGLPRLFGTARYQPLVIAIAVVAEIVAVLVIRRRLKARKTETEGKGQV